MKISPGLSSGEAVALLEGISLLAGTSLICEEAEDDSDNDGGDSRAGNSVPGALGIGGAAGNTPVGLEKINVYQTTENDRYIQTPKCSTHKLVTEHNRLHILKQ